MKTVRLSTFMCRNLRALCLYGATLFFLFFTAACKNAQPVTSGGSILFGNDAEFSNLSLTSTPTNNALVTFNVTGNDVTQFRYAVVLSGASCASATYSADADVTSGLVSVNLITLGMNVENDYKICLCGGTVTNTWQEAADATTLTWHYDPNTPTVSVVANRADPTNASTISFDFQFSETMLPGTFDTTDFTLSAASTGVGTITSISTSDNITFTVNTTITTGSDIFTIALPANMTTDLAGNGNAAGAMSITHDGMPPAVTFVSPGNDSGYLNASSGNTLTITGTCSYSDSSLITITGPILGSPVTGTCVNTAGGTFSESITITGADGAKSIVVSQTDTAGNLGSATRIVTLDTTIPTILSVTSSTADGAYTVGENITLVVTWSEAIIATATPSTIQLETGAIDELATYTGGSGTNIFTYNYTVAASDVSSDLDYKLTTSFTINGTLNDIGGNIPDVTLPTVGGAQSLGGSKAIVIVGSPAVLSISDAATYNYGSVVLNTPTDHTFTITNSGDATATSMSGAALPLRYTYKGGGYPGTGGTCGPILSGSGSTCTVVVTYTPTVVTTDSGNFTMDYNNGVTTTTSSRAITGAGVNTLALSVVPVYSTSNPGAPVIGDPGSNWNDYIKFDNTAGGTNPYDQDSVICSGLETGFYGQVNGCIHSGEKRKVVVTGYSSCASLNITDDLNVFDWVCISNPSTGNVATFFTRALKAGKGLRDLISAGSWNDNFVTVELSGNPIGQSTAAAWWTNPFVDLNTAPYDSSANSVIFSLNTAGAIYYISGASRFTAGYQIGADRISVVSLGAVGLQKNTVNGPANCNSTNGSITSPDIIAILCGGPRNFLWIETKIDGTTGTSYPAQTGILLADTQFSRIHATTISPMSAIGAVQPALWLMNSDNNMLTAVDMYNVGSGLSLENSDLNTIRNLNVVGVSWNNNSARSVSVPTGSDYNHFYDTRIGKHNVGVTNNSIAFAIGGTNNVVSRANIYNIGGGGDALGLLGGANYNIISQVVTTATDDTGIYFVGTAGNNVISHFTAANNFYNGIYFDFGSFSSNKFISNVIANTQKAVQDAGGIGGTGNEFINFFIANNATWGFDLTMGSGFATGSGYRLGGANGSGTCNGTTNAAICTGVSVASLVTAFTGKASSDATNASDTSGTAASISSLAGWVSFDNFMRNWGKDGSAFANSDHRAAAASAFRIWDWTAANAGPLYNSSFSGTTANPNALNTDAAACVASTVISTDYITGAGTTFLRNAIEIDGDLVGDDDALCESNEDCVWAPNIGTYQGTGALSSGYCTVSGAGPTNIDVYKYTTN